MVSERTTERRGNYERTKSFKKTCGCNADDAMTNATNKIKHMATTKNIEGFWSVGLGALHYRHGTRYPRLLYT